MSSPGDRMEESDGPVDENEILRQQLRFYEEDFTKERNERAKAEMMQEALKQELEASRSYIRMLEGRLEYLERESARLEERSNNVNGQQEVLSYDGVLLWRVSDFARKRRGSFIGRGTSIYSPPFYTGRPGYKLCARLYLNGDGIGKGTHISLSLVVMRGQYDELLRWPFRQKVTVMLLDQDNVKHVIDAFRPDPNSSSFQRPRREMNVASGCPLFCPLSELNEHAYVRDDTMHIKVIVDTSGTASPSENDG